MTIHVQKWQNAVLRFRSVVPLLPIPRRYHLQSCRNTRYAFAASQASGSFPPNFGYCTVAVHMLVSSQGLMVRHRRV